MGADLTAEANGLRSLLRDAEVVAVVGLSSKPWRASNQVARYLQEHGYRIVPINPGETEVLGEAAYPTVLDIPSEIHVDVVDVFRRPEHTPEVARQAVRIEAGALWLQEGIVSEEAARIATEGNVDVVMGICIRHVHERLIAQEGER
jgi:predicted CoA-binding protein